MNKELKNQWVKALRSGLFEQGRYQLANSDYTKFCPLGVLCEIAPGISRLPGRLFLYKVTGSNGWGYKEIFSDVLGLPPDHIGNIEHMSDFKLQTFDEIAVWIVENVEEIDSVVE